MSAPAHEKELQTADGHRFPLMIFTPSKGVSECVILCMPAMGVPARYYRTFAEGLADHGFCTGIMDIRGNGASSLRPKRGTDFGYREILEYDVPAALQELRLAHPDSEILLLGHSLGGQLACLFAGLEPGSIQGILLVASGSVYFRVWPFPHSWGLRVFQAVVRASVALAGYFPGHLLGFGGKQARRLMLDWHTQGTSGRYDVSQDQRDYEAMLKKVDTPILAISLAGDNLAPPGSVEHLLRKMPRARVTRETIELSSEGEPSRSPHFAWPHQAHAILRCIRAWRSQVSDPG
jgi:predicted alpha/beta hydrolase